MQGCVCTLAHMPQPVCQVLVLTLVMLKTKGGRGNDTKSIRPFTVSPDPCVCVFLFFSIGWEGSGAPHWLPGWGSGWGQDERDGWTCVFSTGPLHFPVVPTRPGRDRRGLAVRQNKRTGSMDVVSSMTRPLDSICSFQTRIL